MFHQNQTLAGKTIQLFKKELALNSEKVYKHRTQAKNRFKTRWEVNNI